MALLLIRVNIYFCVASGFPTAHLSRVHTAALDTHQIVMRLVLHRRLGFRCLIALLDTVYLFFFIFNYNANKCYQYFNFIRRLYKLYIFAKLFV